MRARRRSTGATRSASGTSTATGPGGECRSPPALPLRPLRDLAFSSNWSSPGTSPVPTCPRAQWQFVDDDISTVDHFHPGLSGQRKMAQAAWGVRLQLHRLDHANRRCVNPVRRCSSRGPVSCRPRSAQPGRIPAGIKGIQYRTHFQRDRQRLADPARHHDDPGQPDRDLTDT